MSVHSKTANERLAKLSSTLNAKANSPSLTENKEHLEEKSDETNQPDIIFEEKLASRIFKLNRPKAYNTMSLDMVRSMTHKLNDWDASEKCKLMIIKSNMDFVFCAGGDLKYNKEDKVEYARTTLKELDQLAYIIANLTTPMVAITDGITMGGGVGLSIHAHFRIATENTIFAMPEAKIGFYPDVGATFFLPRLDGELGTYLGLTGSFIKGKDVFLAGIATHYILSKDLPALEERLYAMESYELDSINQAIEEFSPKSDLEPFFLDKFRPVIDRCFKLNSVKNILNALENEKTHVDWAQKTIRTLRKVSPTSLVVIREQLRRGKFMDISECFKMDYHLMKKFTDGHDFPEGVQAKLFRKSKSPNWNPGTIEEVDKDSIIKEYFSDINIDGLTLPISTKNPPYKQFPHARFTLPSEMEVKAYLTVSNVIIKPTEKRLFSNFLTRKNHKFGVATKLASIVSLKCSVDKESGIVTWKH